MLALAAAIALSTEPIGTYPSCGESGGCPSDFRDWELKSWIPEDERDTIRPAEIELGSGASADVAFRYATGRWDVTVAVLDSGIRWDERSLADKVLIHTGELPLPQDENGTPYASYDADGNGWINVSDYRNDPRVDKAAGHPKAAEILDPSDLIAAFSDGVDDDGNGYVDDIAGWDFFGWDNDPYPALDAGYASHGTGVMKDVAEGGEDGGGIGVCPNCSILPIRTGDTFITDGDRAAMGLLYATDRGARVAAMAMGALTHPEAAIQAVAYAEAHGMVMVGAAGDENSYHHNVPPLESPILYVHSVKQGDDGHGEPYTYFAIWNCNNWGPRVDLVGASPACATGATARIAGGAGLVIAAGRDHGLELSPAEVRALLYTSADDVALTPEEQAIARAYPSKPGWDAFYGYGRMNVGEAVRRVAEAELPPVARIVSPRWYDFGPSNGAPIVVEGVVDAPRGTVASWTLSWGVGPEPREWTQVASGSTAVDGALGLVPTLGLGDQVFGDLDDEDGVLDRFIRAHRPLVQVRLAVTDTDGRTTEDRRGVWVHRDPTLHAGLPMQVRSSSEGGPVLADVTGDGALEIVLTTSDGALHVWKDGVELPGFPVYTDVLPSLKDALPPPFRGDVDVAHEGVASSAGVGDLDGDGDPELVVTSLRGGLYAWHADGTPVAGFPVRIVGRQPEEFVRDASWDDGIVASPALGDVDGDGDLEIVAGAMDQRLYVWDGDGTVLPGYPLLLCHDHCDDRGYRILATAALGDIDADGDLDAALGTNEVPDAAAGVAYVVDLRTATVFPDWPQERDGLINQVVLPVLGEGHPASMALADLDGDGDLELASNAILGSADLIHHDGSVARDLSWIADGFGPDTNYDDGAFLGFATGPAFGDVTGDGRPDFFVGGAGVLYIASLALTRVQDYQHAIGGWDGVTGGTLDGFPRQVDDVSFLDTPVIADVSGDGVPEVLYGSGGYFIYAWDATGTIAPGFPKFTGGWIIGSPAVGDVDGDGFLDVVATTREGWLFVWTTEGRADQRIEWASAHHDPQNTNNHALPIPVQAGPPTAHGCCGRGDPSGSAALLLFLPWWRRRRQ